MTECTASAIVGSLFSPRPVPKLGPSMPSGAGHDAQSIALLAPVGMIFVPSVNGISHSPEEFTEPKDVANGTAVLLEAILTADSRYSQPAAD